MRSESPYLSICVNRRLTGRSPSCGGRNALALADALEQALHGHTINLPLHRSGCLGRCNEGPNLRLAPAGYFLSLDGDTKLELVLDWLKRHLK